MTPTTEPMAADLDGLEALAKAATPGEWTAAKSATAQGRWFVQGYFYGPDIGQSDICEMSNGQREENARFIAAANPATVLQLIALARRAVGGGGEEDVERLSKVYAEATGYYVPFHRGLSSPSSDEIRRGIRAVLAAIRSPE